MHAPMDPALERAEREAHNQRPVSAEPVTSEPVAKGEPIAPAPFTFSIRAPKSRAEKDLVAELQRAQSTRNRAAKDFETAVGRLRKTLAAMNERGMLVLPEAQPSESADLDSGTGLGGVVEGGPLKPSSPQSGDPGTDAGKSDDVAASDIERAETAVADCADGDRNEHADCASDGQPEPAADAGPTHAPARAIPS